MLEFIKVTGPIVAWITVAFLIYDRLIRGRPLASLTPYKQSNTRLTIKNLSDVNIVIREVIFQPAVYVAAKTNSVDHITRAVMGDKVSCIVSPGATVDFPLIVKDAKLEADIKSAIRIIIRWRKTKSMWLPQVPVGIWTSPDAMRELAKTA